MLEHLKYLYKQKNILLPILPKISNVHNMSSDFIGNLKIIFINNNVKKEIHSDVSDKIEIDSDISDNDLLNFSDSNSDSDSDSDSYDSSDSYNSSIYNSS